MVQTLMQLVERLRNIERTPAAQARRRALLEIQRAFEARLVALASARQVDGRQLWSPVTAVGESALVEAVEQCEGQELGEHIDFEHPTDVPVNAFERIDHAKPLAEMTGERNLDMCGDAPCWHAVLYDDERALLGWLFVCVPRRRLSNTDGVAQALTDAIAELSRLLAGADDSLSRTLTESEIHCIFDADGELEQKSESAEEWLETHILELCAQTVSRLAKSDVETLTTSVSGASVSFVRMLGDGQTRYLMEASDAPPPCLATDWQLTDRQREVAYLAADGMTAREIGEELGIAYNTVKKHLQNIYRKLGVASRLELADRLDKSNTRRAAQ
jgi:DNA-binding CsgD family transcriptional regulator